MTFGWRRSSFCIALLASLAALVVGCQTISPHDERLGPNTMAVTGSITLVIPVTSSCYDIRNTGGFGYHGESSGGGASVEVGIPWTKSAGSFKLAPSASGFRRDGKYWTVVSGTFSIDHYDGSSASGRLDADYALTPRDKGPIHVSGAWTCSVQPFVVR